MPAFPARVVSSGEELLLGHIADENAAWIARALLPLGGEVLGVRVVGDRLPDLVDALRDAARHAALVVLTGGLGPTGDDRARDALAAVLGTPLRENPDAWRAIQKRFAAMDRPCPDDNRVQALIPEGARMLDNPVGTAPGLAARVGDADVFWLPGVPMEMRVLFERHVAPAVRARHGAHGTLAVRRLRVTGAGESVVGTAVREWMVPDAPVQIGTTVADSLVTVRLEARAQPGEAPDDVLRRMEDVERAVRDRLGAHVYGVEDETLGHAVVRLLASRGETLATAESCTGGRVADAVVSTPGASAVFREGVVAYANAAKTARLGVPAATIDRHGAVSEAVVRAMAEGARAGAGVDWAVATTGVAGPDGGTPEKPVGFVWMAVAGPDGTTAWSRRFTGDRDRVRRTATHAALDGLRRRLAGEMA